MRGKDPTCGLYVDLDPLAQPPISGDWIATAAGSRYLITDVRLVIRRARHQQTKRYAVRCDRLEIDAEVPDDVRVIWLQWYPRQPKGRTR